MAVNIFQTFQNPVSKESFTYEKADAESCVMRWRVEPGGYVPFEHIHLNQDEIFEVQSGEIRLQMDGRETIARVGDTVTVPAGVAHIAFNNSDQPLECRVTYRPGLDLPTFIQCFGGVLQEGDYDPKTGEPNLIKLGFFLRHMKAKCMTRPTQFPAWSMGLALNLFYYIGLLRGWKKDFDRYTSGTSRA